MFHFILGKKGFAVSTSSSIMKVNNFKQTLKYSLLCVRIMQLRENSNFLTKKKQYVTFCLSALVKWNTQAYLKLSFTSHNDKIIKA